MDSESIGGLNLYTYCLNNPVTYYDPNGNLALSTVIILGLVGIGAVVGVGTVVYLDNQDDGQIFNGSIGWETYLAAALLGGIIGGVLGYYAGPTIASLLANPGNISLASLVFAGGGSTGGLTISVAAVGQIALAGAISTTAIGTIGATYMFSKHEPKMTNKPPFSWVSHQEGIDAIKKWLDRIIRKLLNL